MAQILPADSRSGKFLGRIETPKGPSPVMIVDGEMHDLSTVVATIAGAIEERVFDVARLDPVPLTNAVSLLSPIDLQCVKAAGVTFALSAIERVIEERARGDAAAADGIRSRIEEQVGGGLRLVVPGSPQAAELKRVLIADDLWSQYLEVAIGPDAEIFTKAPILSTVGYGAPIGVRSDSRWNNPEPEVVLVCDSGGQAVGAALGNDVNLRDFEGRSALLLGKAKDNTASCAIGPFIRLFDDDFTMDDVRQATVTLAIEGPDGFRLDGTNRMSEISRDPLDLVAQTMSEHQYPDGFALFLGTLFAPTQDRDEPGQGFTHKMGDRVTIASERLGTLTNTVTTSRDAPAWTFGVRELVRNLHDRGLADRI